LITHANPTQRFTDIAAALKSAAASHKRVILDFGGNWCTDCHVLDLYFHDANVDVAARYQIPLTKGVPAVVEAMRHMQTGAVTDFLVRWKRPAS
jgi:thioredoxin 1